MCGLGYGPMMMMSSMVPHQPRRIADQPSSFQLAISSPGSIEEVHWLKEREHAQLPPYVNGRQAMTSPLAIQPRRHESTKQSEFAPFSRWRPRGVTHCHSKDHHPTSTSLILFYKNVPSHPNFISSLTQDINMTTRPSRKAPSSLLSATKASSAKASASARTRTRSSSRLKSKAVDGIDEFATAGMTADAIGLGGASAPSSGIDSANAPTQCLMDPSLLILAMSPMATMSTSLLRD